MSSAYLRTQILLPPALRRKIDLDRQSKNESLSEYLRRAVQLRLSNEKKKSVDLEQLIEEVIGGLDLSKYPQWATRKMINEWQRDVRREKGL